MMRLPSAQAITNALTVSEGVATQVYRALGFVAVEWREGMSEAQRMLVDVKAFTCLDTQVSSLIGGHGVEVVHGREMNDALYYVNMGDPYRPTLMFDCKTLQFRLGAWGAMVEKYPRRFGDA